MPNDNEPRWSLPLTTPPFVRYAGVGRHGDLEPAHWYHYPRSWCLHAYQYRGVLTINGIPHLIYPGSVSLVAPNTHFEHHWPQPDCRHFFAIFEFPAPSEDKAMVIPGVLRFGKGFADFTKSLEPIVYGSASQPVRAAARLWEVLWTLAEHAQATTLVPTEPHPALLQARRWMQDHPTECCRLAELAAKCRISPNHLIRLFRREYGMSPVAWHRQNRIHRAEHLLRHSSLSVKAVAAETGFTDLQQFNKLVRRFCGSSPTRIQAGMA